MSRYSQYNKNDTYLANLNYANLQKQRRNQEELKEIERDRIAMEKLQIELNQEKQLEKERKNQIRQQQYEDYSNFVKQKYSETPQSKENINIKLGNEQRYIRKPNYQQQMENLCLNPTRNKNIYNNTPITNFSEAGRQYQRGYSHGYNILTGEAFTQEFQKGKTPQNVNINNNAMDNNNKLKEPISQNNYNNNNVIINDEKEKEELRQYQEYMEMKRKKELEQQEQEALYYMEQQKQNQKSLMQEQERERERDISNQKENMEQYQINPQAKQKMNYHNQINEYNPKEELYNQMRNNPNEIPPEYKDIYNKERLPPNQIQQPSPEEIPPEYREMYMRENNQIPPYQNQQEEINTYIPKQKEEIKSKENENVINREINTKDDYRQYQLNKQEMIDKEKEEENMEIYQNMLKEKENQEREKELYRQYLLEQQRQNPNINDIKEQDINPNQINENQNQQYQEIRENQIPKEETNERNNIGNKPINSFEEYYKQKNINIPESQPEIKNQPEIQPKDKYENENYQQYEQYPPEIPQNKNMYPQSQEPISEEQAYMMYQQQKNREELERLEMEKERARQILLQQQKEKEKMIQEQNPNQYQNDYYQQNYNNSSPYYNPNNNKNIQEPIKMSEFNSAKMEYLKNKQKNLLTKDNIFSVSEIPKTVPKYNNEPLTNADRLRIQREYAQFLDSQINAKNLKNKKNNGLNMEQSSGYEIEGPNPYEQMRNKHSKLRDIPQDPYSVKNYNISNNSYLSSNPITNPVNSYKFVDKRRVSSGRLQNSGSNIIKK